VRPGVGVRTQEVSYSINGGASRVVYSIGNVNDFEPTVVNLATGTNEIVFTVTDAAGRVGMYTVQVIAVNPVVLQVSRG